MPCFHTHDDRSLERVVEPPHILKTGLAEKTVEFTSGGGMVTATAKGDMTIASIKIDPEVVDPEDVEMLEDMVVAAVDGALKAAKEMSAEAMGKLTGGMGLPGMPGM